MSWKAPSGIPLVDSIAFKRIWKIVRFDSPASLPPLKIVAFPLFRQSDMTWGTTSGLDSKITPIKPMGQLTW